MKYSVERIPARGEGGNDAVKHTEPHRICDTRYTISLLFSHLQVQRLLIKMRGLSVPLLSFLLATAHAAPASQTLDFSSYAPVAPQRRADPTLTSYLGAFFLGDKPSVYFYQSNGNNGLSFKALNKGQPVINPTLGTRGVRDPSLIAGGGNDLSRKWYIVSPPSPISSSCTDMCVFRTDRYRPQHRKNDMGCRTTHRQ